MEALAKLRNYPTSPRKMRLLADLIRGKQVEKALAILEFSPKHPAVPMRKLVLSAINNWKQKNEGQDESLLLVKTIFVDGARMVKRMRPAPQGRGYKIRKRSNHVTIIVDLKETKGGNFSKNVKNEVEEPLKKVPTKKAAAKSSKTAGKGKTETTGKTKTAKTNK